MDYKISSLTEIGMALERDSKDVVSDATLASEVGCAQSSISRIKTGEREPGVLLFTKIALFLGKTPNDYLLRDQITAQIQEGLQSEDVARVRRMVDIFMRIRARFPTGPDPLQISLEAVEAIETSIIQRYGPPIEDKRPVGISHVDEQGIQVIEPIPKKYNRDKNGGTAKFRASEAPGRYGNKKKKEK